MILNAGIVEGSSDESDFAPHLITWYAIEGTIPIVSKLCLFMGLSTFLHFTLEFSITGSSKFSYCSGRAQGNVPYSSAEN